MFGFGTRQISLLSDYFIKWKVLFYKERVGGNELAILLAKLTRMSPLAYNLHSIYFQKEVEIANNKISMFILQTKDQKS